MRDDKIELAGKVAVIASIAGIVVILSKILGC